MNLGTALFARKKYEDATVSYQTALKLDPEVFERHGNFGVLLEERSVEEKAKYHFYLAKLYAKDGRHELALQYLRKSLEEGFKELAARWKPILDFADENGVDFAYELHPGEDLYDGATFEMFLEATGNHPRVNINYDPSHFILQCLDYVGFIDVYGSRIKAFHVKDAEFRPSAKAGVYGGYLGWKERPGRFRSLGDGQVDFKAIFSKFAQYDFKGWAVLEWECCLKHPEQGAAEGVAFIRDHIIRVTDKAFDDFAGSGSDPQRNKRMLGIG